MTRSPNEVRDLLRRYGAVLAQQLRLEDVKLCSKRFRTNHRIAADDPIIPAMGRIFEAHRARVEGLGSPDACDAAVKAEAA